MGLPRVVQQRWGQGVFPPMSSSLRTGAHPLGGLGDEGGREQRQLRKNPRSLPERKEFRKAVAAEVCSSKCGPWTHGIRKSCWKYRIPGPTADFWMKTGHLTRPPGILTHPSSRSPTETGGSHAWRRTRIPDLCGNTRGSPHHPSSRADSGVRWAQGSEFLSSYLPALI